MCALPVEARQEAVAGLSQGEEVGIQPAKKVELKLVPSPVEDAGEERDIKMEKLPIRLVLDQKFERMNQIMARWQHEPAPTKPADLGEEGMSFDLIAFVNLHDAVKNHPNLLNAEQQVRYQEVIIEAQKRFDKRTLERIGVKNLS